MNRYDELQEWYLALYRERSLHPKSVLDVAEPQCRVLWVEILDKMRELGFHEHALDLVPVWQQLMNSRFMRRAVAQIEKERKERLKTQNE